MSLRRSSLPRHGRRALVASGMAAALVAVPGVALASETTSENPVEDAPAVVQQLTEELPVSVPEAGSDTTDGTDTDVEGTGDPVDDVTGAVDGVTGAVDDVTGTGDPEDEEADTDGSGGGGAATPELPALPPFVVPDDARAAFKELTRQLGIADSCVDGIADSVELIVGGLLDPEQLEAIIAELEGLLEEFGLTLEDLTGGLGGGLGGDTDLLGALAMDDLAADAQAIEDVVPGAGDSAPGGDFVTGIELLVTTLSEDCVPELPGGEGSETPTIPVDNGTDVPPAAEHPAPVQPVAQPVAYPGYAPTGADLARADDTSVPLTALGGGLVLVAAGAAGYGMRGRAVRTRD